MKNSILLAQDISGVANNTETLLVSIGATIVAIAVILLGIRLLLKFKAQEALREAFQGLGVLLLGATLVGSGTLIAGILTSTGSTLTK